MIEVPRDAPSPCHNAWKCQLHIKFDFANFPELQNKKARHTNDASMTTTKTVLTNERTEFDGQIQTMKTSFSEQLTIIKEQGAKKESKAKACIAAVEQTYNKAQMDMLTEYKTWVYCCISYRLQQDPPMPARTLPLPPEPWQWVPHPVKCFCTSPDESLHQHFYRQQAGSFDTRYLWPPYPLHRHGDQRMWDWSSWHWSQMQLDQPQWWQSNQLRYPVGILLWVCPRKSLMDNLIATHLDHTTTTSTTHSPMNVETNPTPTTTNNYEPEESPYSKYHLPPRQQNHICLIFNNMNSLHTKSLAELMAKVKQYLSYEPTVLRIIETNRNWAHSDQTTKPLQTTLNVMNQDCAKVTTAHYREQHSVTNTYQPGSVAQITLKPLSNRIDSIDSNRLGQWSHQEMRLDGTCSLFIYTGYWPCKAPANSKKTTTWDQQVRGMMRRGITDPNP